MLSLPGQYPSNAADLPLADPVTSPNTSSLHDTGMKIFGMKLKVTVNPNPFVSELFVSIQAEFTVNVVIRLIADNEKVIKITAGTLKTGENEIPITNLHQYATGNYRLEIKLLNGDLLQNIQLVKHSTLSVL